jgi:OOP family OmpA-OmpF porin
MRRTLLLIGVLFAVSPALSRLSAQEPDFGKNFIGAKVLFIDYFKPNASDEMRITNGIEALYQRNLNPYLSFAIPGKFMITKVLDERDNRRMMSLDGLLHVHWYQPQARLWPYALGGAGVVWENFDGYNYQFPVGAGLNIRVGKHSYVNVQGEYRLSSQENRKNLQAGLGFLYRLGIPEPDRDGDGVPDAADRCPDVPGPRELAGCPDRDGDGVPDIDDECPDVPGLAALAGCPDRDGDGVPDKDDQCPDEPGLVELFGCPDRDGDGIADRFDRCPDEPGPASNQGCPIADRDGDGIPDEMDLCPDEPGPAATRGCPDRDVDGVHDKDDACPDQPGPVATRGCPDTDGDGVPDDIDKCPDEPGPASNQGCPEIKEEVKEILRFAMRAVQFETGKSTLKGESFAVLDQIVDIMAQYPSYRLRISGHTDSVGDDQANQVLSEERAKACYQYLVSKGVSPARLAFFGYGETRPIADNRTAQGRSLNRRVEFDLHLEGE